MKEWNQVGVFVFIVIEKPIYALDVCCIFAITAISIFSMNSM
jgi:hypothetical protein